jgi:IS30 family transposase
MIRRFVAKGRDIATFTNQSVASVESWINNYPRRILGFSTPSSLFTQELRGLSLDHEQ